MVLQYIAPQWFFSGSLGGYDAALSCIHLSPGPTHEGCHCLLQRSVCCFILGLFSSCLVKELARIGPWKENMSFSFLFHTFPGVSTELWVFGPTSWEFQETSSEGNYTCAMTRSWTRSGWQVPTGSSVKYMAMDGTPLDSS